MRKACGELVAKLKPFAEELEEQEATWEGVVQRASLAGGPFDPCKVGSVL